MVTSSETFERRFRRSVLLLLALFLTAYILYTRNKYDAFDGTWTKTDYGWVHSFAAPEDQEYCLYPDHHGGLGEGGTRIAQRNPMIGRKFMSVTDPMQDRAPSPLRVHAKAYCVSKKRGEPVEYRMIESKTALWLEIW